MQTHSEVVVSVEIGPPVGVTPVDGEVSVLVLVLVLWFKGIPKKNPSYTLLKFILNCDFYLQTI